MITTEKLYKFIAALKSEEKRFFTLMVERQEAGGTQQYMELFRLMDGSIAKDPNGEPLFTYTEEQLQARMKRKGVPESRFHVVRNQLAQMLLKALRLMQEDRTQEDSIRILLKEAKLLERRGNFEWAQEKSEEALELAKTYEYYPLAVEALRNLVYVRSQGDTSGYADKIKVHLQEIETLTAHYEQEQGLFSLHFQTILLYRTRGGITATALGQEVGRLTNDPALADMETVVSFSAKTYFQQAKAILADIQGGGGKALPYYAATVELWESESYRHFQAERPRQFFVHLFNFLGFCIMQADFVRFERHFKTLEGIKTTNFDDEAELFQNRVFLQQLYFLNRDRFEDAKKLIQTIEKGLKKYAFKINKSRLYTIRYHIILTYFMLEEYDHVQTQCDILQRYGKSEQRRDVQLFTKILRNIVFLELEDYEELKKFVKSVKGNLITIAGPKDFERILLTYLVQLADVYLKDQIASRKRTEAIIRVFGLFERELLDFQTAQPQVPLGFEEILIWVRKKLKV